MTIKTIELLNRNDQLEELLIIWERSVRATHHFLTEADIVALRPSVESGLRGITHLIIAADDENIAGFIGVEEDSIEMLFLDPAYFRRGIGKQLMMHAMDQLGVVYVDVNEANQSAYRFYQSLGFDWFDRSETDAEGNSFPILHLKLCD